MSGRHIILLCVLLTLIASFAASAPLMVAQGEQDNHQINGLVKRESSLCVKADRSDYKPGKLELHSKPWWKFW